MTKLLGTLSLFCAVTLTSGNSFADVDAANDALLKAYRPLHVALTKDDADSARAVAKEVRAEAARWIDTKGTDHPQYARVSQIAAGAAALEATTDLKSARLAFCRVAEGIVELARSDEDLKAAWQLFFCSMTAEAGFPYGFWVQPKGERIANPYFGSEMLSCGMKKKW